MPLNYTPEFKKKIVLIHEEEAKKENLFQKAAAKICPNAFYNYRKHLKADY